ncbi:MAG: 2Fe-2S iron-sulfur cluster-binding protein, partial [Pseudomonadota bacterium]
MVELTVNGKKVRAEGGDDARLLFFLRDELGLTGTKFGCGVAMCGACTVHIDGQAAYACQTYLSDLEGAEVTTIEGLS